MSETLDVMLLATAYNERSILYIGDICNYFALFELFSSNWLRILKKIYTYIYKTLYKTYVRVSLNER